RTAALVARWQAVGFCHGVLNTDNLSILGLTIDYGPFGFLDAYDAGHVCNHSDETGRYRYSLQPAIADWNLRCLAQALLPLAERRGASADDLLAVLAQWPRRFGEARHAAFAAKLGLERAAPGDDALLAALLDCLQEGRVDFTAFFRRLSRVRRGGWFAATRNPAWAIPARRSPSGTPARATSPRCGACTRCSNARTTSSRSTSRMPRCRPNGHPRWS